MQSGPSQFIDPGCLADTQDDISGTISIEGMRRLQELLSSNIGLIQYKLLFDKDEQGRIRLSGGYRVTLGMECQRCLQQVDVDIDRSVDVVLLADENEAKTLPGEIEPLIVSAGKLSLQAFFEEELLLALPLAPKHDTKKCHLQTQKCTSADDRQHPFRVLKDLKLKNSKD